MSSLPMEVIEMIGQTLMKVVPVTIALGLVFSVLGHFWACNPGKPWWRKREIITDICYWFFVPVFARVFRIGLLVLGAGLVFNIHDVDGLVAFPRLPMPDDGTAFVRRLRTTHGVAVTPGELFGAPQHIRVGLGLDPRLFGDGLAVLEDVLS